MIEQAILHTDGGSRGNPGPSGIGFVILVDDGRELQTLTEGGAYIGEATNNVAEYQALIWGLTNARALEIKQLEVKADSELMVKQIKGEYKVKNEGIKPLHSAVMHLLASFDSYRVLHVYREDNARADALANEAMDSLGTVGNYTVACDVGATTDVAQTPQDTVHASSPSPDTPRITSAPQETMHFAKDSLFAPTEDNISKDELPVTEEKIMFQSTSSTEKGAGIYSLTVKNHFDAAHALVGYPGECKNLHGHTWDIEATVSGTKLDEVGIVYDFKALKKDLAAILNDYDHKYLNEVPPFDAMNATAENLAREIFERLEASLPEGIWLDEVAVWESPIAKLTYRKG